MVLLRFMIKDYLEDKELSGLAPRTIQSYRDTLNEFSRWLTTEREIVNIEDITPPVIKSYLLYCSKERGNTVVTRNGKLQHLKTFFRYLEDEDIIEIRSNPTNKIKPGKTDKTIKVYSDEQIKQMLRYYRRMRSRENTLYSYRGHTIIVILAGTGIRLGELISMRWDSVDLLNKTITVFGKNRKSLSTPLTEKVTRELYEYRLFCEGFYKRLPEYVFTDNRGKQLTPNAIKLTFSRLSQRVGFKTTAHMFRHTYASNSLKAGMDIYTLSKLMHHSQIRTTEMYLHAFGNSLAESNDKYNPLNRFDF
ncbi:integrase [Bacillus sp. MYb209]|uniref:tyrosine-type recombinase/integrase n=1 Tax=Bacillus sp. MYb209 TaxID=1848605 RepID=UPI000CFAB85C|nr:tyrosine-type recombinase/integrase [Bacillus sp. MYb209]PQZ53965.1 integrase [Bacillus sp. MYb209]